MKKKTVIVEKIRRYEADSARHNGEINKLEEDIRSGIGKVHVTDTFYPGVRLTIRSANTWSRRR
jgi:hypothetical protein